MGVGEPGDAVAPKVDPPRDGGAGGVAAAEPGLDGEAALAQPELGVEAPRAEPVAQTEREVPVSPLAAEQAQERPQGWVRAEASARQASPPAASRQAWTLHRSNPRQHRQLQPGD